MIDESLDSCIAYLGTGAKIIGELYEVEEFVAGHPVMTKLADVVNGEWFSHDERRVNMAKVKNAVENGNKKAARDVAADLLGDGDKKSGKKGAAPKAPAPKAATASRIAIDPNKKIKVVGKVEFREGSKNAKMFAMIQKSATVKDYLKARAKAGLGSDVGGFFNGLMKAGTIKLT